MSNEWPERPCFGAPSSLASRESRPHEHRRAHSAGLGHRVNRHWPLGQPHARRSATEHLARRKQAMTESKGFPAELAIMEAEAAGDPLGHGHAVLAMRIIPTPRPRSRLELLGKFVLAVIGFLALAVIVLGGAAVTWGIMS